MPIEVKGGGAGWLLRARDIVGAFQARLRPAGDPSSPALSGGHRTIGLSTKLLLLTIAFVMLAEVLIFLPSVANFRVVWLVDRLTAARIAALAADASAGGEVPVEVKRELLETANVRSISIKLGGMRRMVLPAEGAITIDRHVDLRPQPAYSPMPAVTNRFWLIADALAVFVAPNDRMLRVLGHPASAGANSFGPDDFVEIALPEAPLRAAMISYALNILVLSIIISVITAALIYLALNWLLVRPIGVLSASMLRFAERPEDPERVIEVSARGDEIGTAERELQRLQRDLQHMLKQKDHLAQLGLAVSKINHDLRNMLASSQLMSDRLSSVDDPTVQRFAPKLIASLDRAISFCDATLRYGRAEEARPRRDMLVLADLVEEVGEGLGLPRDSIAWRVDIEPRLLIDADRDQLYRVLNNLVRNAVQALHAVTGEHEKTIIVSAARDTGRVKLRVSDSGPGIPLDARDGLFQPFQARVRQGGTGLGLAIAAELVRAHGGRLSLEDDGHGQGASFLIEVPDRSLVRSVTRTTLQ